MFSFAGDTQGPFGFAKTLQNQLKIVPWFWSRFYAQNGAKIDPKMVENPSKMLPWNVNDSKEAPGPIFLLNLVPWTLKMSFSPARGAKIHMFAHFMFSPEIVKKASEIWPILKPKSFKSGFE